MPDEGVFQHSAVDVAACDVTANLSVIKKKSEFTDRWNLSGYRTDVTYPQALAGIKLPLQVSVECSDVHASGDVDALRDVIDVLQRPLDTIKDGAHDSWTQLHGERFPRPQHGIPNRHTGWTHAQQNKFGRGCRTISNVSLNKQHFMF